MPPRSHLTSHPWLWVTRYPSPSLAPHKVTLARRTHALLEAVETARKKLAGYLAERQKAEAARE